MKRVGNLMPQIAEFSNVLKAFKRAARGKKHQTEVAWFNFHLERKVVDIQMMLTSSPLSYQPRPYKMFEVRDPKPRKICAPHFEDRVVHHAVCHIIEPVFEKHYIEDSWACRKGKGSHQAIRRAQTFSRKNRYYLKMDIAQFFASVDHVALKQIIRKVIKDNAVLALLDCIIKHNPPYAEEGVGLPIGNLTSQHFANLYLTELDHFIKSECRVKHYLRYMDDFVLFAHSKQQLKENYIKIKHFLATTLSLQLKPSATVLSPVASGLGFLGFTIFPSIVRLNNRTKYRFIKRKNRLMKKWAKGEVDENTVQITMQSMIAHISQADTYAWRQRLFN